MRAGRKSAEAKTALTLPSSTSSPAGRRSGSGCKLTTGAIASQPKIRHPRAMARKAG